MFFTLSPFTGARIETVPSRGYRDGSFPEDYELILRWIDQGARIGKVSEVLFEWYDLSSRLS